MKYLKFFLKNILEKLHTIPSISKCNNFKKTLNSNLFILVDVGATGGMDGNWHEIKDFCHYITFDPDPRAQIINSFAKHSNYTSALWSEIRENLFFYLTKNPAASTLYKLNQEILSSFLNSECHKTTKISPIKTNSIDNLIKASFDFIKIDAEGADLEILKGANKLLKDSCLGIEVEVSFINRHLKAPLFSDIDIYLRNLDFFLIDLKTEKWIKKNNCFSTTTNPQLIWGNAVFLLSKQGLLKKMINSSDKKREIIFTKYLIILLIYSFHDYAIELCDYLNENKMISHELLLKYKKLTVQSMPSKLFHISKLFFSIMIPLILIVFIFPFKKARFFLIDYLKKRLKELSQYLLKISRYGHNKSCIAG
jgi:FkbM family methyltransferase